METPTTERNNKLYFWDPNAPAPYTVNPGYSFTKALTDAGIDPAQVQTPAWVQNGFPKGAIRVAGTPDFPGRSGQYLHPWQFAPRIGAAYRVTSKTVVRGSFGQTYLSTTGLAEVRLSKGSAYHRLRSEEHTSELQSHLNLVFRLLLVK